MFMKKRIYILISILFLLSCQKEEKLGQIRIPPGVPAKLFTNIPQPVLTDHQHFLEIYWKAWQLLEKNVRQGNSDNGFVDSYLKEGTDELIYQWDTCFMALFAMYGRNLFPAIQSLDNFYSKQRNDGWISRAYQVLDGKVPALPSPKDPMIHPPLFALVEWKYFLLSGDNSRIRKNLEVLHRYYQWMDQNTRSQMAAQGLYCNTLPGSGMDNSPREGINWGGWVDLSAQMALFAKYMMFMAREVGNDTLNEFYERKYRLLIRIINGKMWDEDSQFYYDINIYGDKKLVKTSAAFWTLISEVATFSQARQLAEHLMNPEEFYRNHLFPTLSADHPLYDGLGNYWRGGVWAPINYMIIKGLDMYPLRELAATASLNHIEQMYQVFKYFHPADQQIVAKEIDNQYQTIWECYAPDYPQPGIHGDAKDLSRKDFAGCSGLGPVALLLENIIGLQPSAPKNELYWNLRLREQHGVKNYRFGENIIDIMCVKNELPVGQANIFIHSNHPFSLIVSSQVGVMEFEVVTGNNRFEIKL
jgi:hypothetical protein